MDCCKLIQIYNRSCNKKYSLESTFLNPPTQITQIEFEKVLLKADNNCLKSMEMIYKYCDCDCDMNYRNKNENDIK